MDNARVTRNNWPDDLEPASVAADAVGCHVSTIYRWGHRGLLPMYRVGLKKLLVRRSDVDALLVREGRA